MPEARLFQHGHDYAIAPHRRKRLTAERLRLEPKPGNAREENENEACPSKHQKTHAERRSFGIPRSEQRRLDHEAEEDEEPGELRQRPEINGARRDE